MRTGFNVWYWKGCFSDENKFETIDAFPSAQTLIDHAFDTSIIDCNIKIILFDTYRELQAYILENIP